LSDSTVDIRKPTISKQSGVSGVAPQD